MTRVLGRQPLYEQLVDLLRERIENDMETGELLPSERKLAHHFGLSRTTVRFAMDRLEALGLITRIHGKGTFVAEHSLPATNLMGTYSFTDQMRGMGRTPETRILEFEIVDAPHYVARHLKLHEDDKVFRMRRLRLADNIPMMVERTYVPLREFLTLTREKLEQRSLYDLIENEYGQTIRNAEEEFSASIACSDEARLLGISEGSAVLRLVRTTYSIKNLAVEFTRSVARADQFKYKISHYRN